MNEISGGVQGLVCLGSGILEQGKDLQGTSMGDEHQGRLRQDLTAEGIETRVTGLKEH